MQVEHEIQRAYFKWVGAAKKVYAVLGLAFAVPNEAKRTFKVAAMLKARGMRKGVLDVILPFSRRGYSGMAIEFKSPEQFKTKNHGMTDEQLEFAELLEKEGWLVVVLCDAEKAVNWTRWYLAVIEDPVL